MWKTLKKIAGSGRVNKMWAGALAPAIVSGGLAAFGIEVAPAIELALVTVLTGGVVWRVPNT